MELYEHTQSGSMTRIPLALGLALCAVIFFTTLNEESQTASIIVGAVFGLLLLLLALFHSLTVRVSRNDVSATFGIGWIRRAYMLTEISGAECVRNKWYYGFGIRLTPSGWLYNVGGLDAVELQLTSGQKVRIGTDDPENLCEAILQAKQGAATT